ncbi:MAG: chemotaxis protein CheB [Anaerolineae bacterium]|nr:chemotaxis protein CheB [Anaerolineae bacterium]
MVDRPAGHQVVVIGVSAGGMAALEELLPAFPATYPWPIVVVQHLHPVQDTSFIQRLNEKSALTVKEADEKEPLEAGHAYFAPPNYHLMIEDDRTFALSVDEKVNYARPAIDVLFESAADVYGDGVIGVILTGANEDGAQGLRMIKARGGVAIVQDPKTAQVPLMPQAAIAAIQVDHVLTLPEIVTWLVEKG